MAKLLLIFGLTMGTSMGQDCWWSGCQPNDWQVKGCAQYGRDERGRDQCWDGRNVEGNKYNCCTRNGGGNDCWWTGCQPNDWQIKGCDQYGRDEKGRTPCKDNGKDGNIYNCCVRSGGGGGCEPNCNGGKGFVSIDKFRNAVTSNGYPAPTQEQYDNFNNLAAVQGRILSVEEAAMCLAQLLHESAGLRAKRELACEHTNCTSSYRTPDCDVADQYYYGRGYIQLTWCSNYRDASLVLFNDTSLVTDPDSVARNDSIAWRTAFWFWSSRVHDAPGVQQGHFGATTKAINGGIECSAPGHPTPEIRFNLYEKVRAAFGLLGPGDRSGCA